MKAGMLACLLAAALAVPGWAAQVPEAGKGDARIRFVDYDPYNVVTIYGQIGISTMIVFEPDEKIINKGAGDGKAWGILVHDKGNSFAVKPAATAPATNIQIITTKRTYNFDMKLATARLDAYWAVHFRYPAAARAAEAKEQEADKVRTLLERGTPVGNRNYTVEGASVIEPIEVWDDGTHTYFRFPQRATIPTIYSSRENGDANLEKMENVSVRGDDVVQVQGVRRRFVLRVGSREVACVYNDGYTLAGPRMSTNTASPQVRRVIKGAKP